MANTPYARLRVGGKLYGDASWSIGLNFAQTNGDDPFVGGQTDVPGALETWADAVRQLNGGKIFPPAMQTGVTTNGDFEFVRAARIGTDGKESDVGLIELNPLVPGDGSSRHSAQTALVVSLVTGRPGASYRGRLYLPALGYGVGANGRILPADAAAVAAAAGQWIGAVANAFPQGATPFDVVPIVVSTVKSARTRVTSVRVGNRLDTQRRRAESEQESYSVAPVTQ